MWKYILAVLVLFGLLTTVIANDDSTGSPEEQMQYNREAFVVLTDGEEIYISGFTFDESSLTIVKWRTSKNDNWREVPRSISIDRIANIEFQPHRISERGHGMNFMHKGWMWGGVMILMMLIMLTGNMM